MSIYKDSYSDFIINNNNNKNDKNFDIEHLVLPGGGIGGGLLLLGILLELEKQNKINIKNINSIYYTSIGSIIGFFILSSNQIDSFKYFKKYIHSLDFNKFNSFQNIPQKIISSFNNKGIIDITIVKEFIYPFMEQNNIPFDITLKQFHELTHKSLYIYATTFDTLQSTELSHRIFPDMKLIEAIYFSSCIVPIFKLLPYNEPNTNKEYYFIDGGFSNNYPIYQCIQNNIDKTYTILGIHIHSCSYTKQLKNTNIINISTNLLLNIFNKSYFSTHNYDISKYNIHEIFCEINTSSVYNYENLFSLTKINKFIRKGKIYASFFIKYKL